LGTDLTFKWTDNEDATFVNWAAGEPNNYDGVCLVVLEISRFL